MTFKEFMKEIGYDLMTTFWEDFSDAAGDRWVKREEFRFRGDAACSAWRNATVDEIVEHFKNR